MVIKLGEEMAHSVEEKDHAKKAMLLVQEEVLRLKVKNEVWQN
jgi:hypothetical protein